MLIVFQRLFGGKACLVLLEESPFLALLWLTTLAMVAPLDGIAHGRHGGDCSVLSRLGSVLETFLMFTLIVNRLKEAQMGIKLRSCRQGLDGRSLFLIAPKLFRPASPLTLSVPLRSAHLGGR